jgi:pentatricopeptide repeat protein
MVDQRIATKTLAKVYLSQGDPRKALEIYCELLKREPSNSEIREAVRKLRCTIAQSPGPLTSTPSQELTRMEKIRNLEQWQERIQTIRRLRKERETE